VVVVIVVVVVVVLEAAAVVVVVATIVVAVMVYLFTEAWNVTSSTINSCKLLQARGVKRHS